MDIQGSVFNVYKSHLVLLLQLSWPNILTSLASLALPVTSTLAVGHLGSPTFIGAAALGNMFANATGFAVGSGLSMALDTLCSQAFGAKKYRLVGLHCQRAMVILTIACIPITIVWINAWVILQFIGTEETKEVTELSQYWIIRLIPSLWPRLMYESYRRYLLAQRVMWPLTLSVLMIVPIHILNTYLFVYHFEGGFSGAVWATNISYWLLFFSIILVSHLRVRVLRKREENAKLAHTKLKQMDDLSESGDDTTTESDDLYSMDDGSPLDTWPSWSKDVLRGWISYMRLGVATTLSLIIEWGSFEVNAAIAARLGAIPLAAHAILSNVASIWYSAPLGVGSACSAVVGNMLGAGEPERARIFARLAFMVAFVYGLLNGAIGLLYRDHLGRFFTSETPVVRAISSVMLVMWFYGLVDALKAVGMAILRGSGRPKVTVYGNVLSCLIVGYPVALLMVMKGNFGLPGLWFGMSTAWLSASAIYIIIITRTDWKLEVLKAAQRNVDAENSTRRGAETSKQGVLFNVIVSNGQGKVGINSEDTANAFSIGEDKEESDEKDSFLVENASE